MDEPDERPWIEKITEICERVLERAGFSKHPGREQCGLPENRQKGKGSGT
jgi:hypothetical protein